MSQLQNALKKRTTKRTHKNKRPSGLTLQSETITPSTSSPSQKGFAPIVFSSFGNKKTKPLSKTLSRQASCKGFARLQEADQQKLPIKVRRQTPRPPSKKSSTTTTTESKTNSKTTSGDVRWIRIADETNAGNGDNYVVAKFIGDSEANAFGKKKLEFELLDWKCKDGTSVNDSTTYNIGDKVTVHLLDVGPRIETESELHQTYSDMVNLPVVHQATVLHNLKRRYMSSNFMTNIGSILIILNPFEFISELYGLDIVREFTDGHGNGDTELPPHVYGLAQAAYRGLVRTRSSQAILIAGESGAGKTETTKKCLQYLAEVGGGTLNCSLNDGDVSIEDRILSANPIFEAFGNAKTVRNNNSSRFGKWLEVIFHPTSLKLIGCQTIQYLLEKSRVVKVALGERNYSIFYQLLAGIDDATATKLHITNRSSNHYNYLQTIATSNSNNNNDGNGNGNGDGTSSSSFDHDNYSMVEDAMSSMGFPIKTMQSILSIVAAILHIGNITFETNANDHAVIATDSKAHVSLVAAAHCLSVDFNELSLAIVTKRLMIVGERTDKPINVEDATNTRDALSKSLYNTLFAKIVEQINIAMLPSTESSHELKIGILDIFGFEIFEYNSLEQLCINFTNEKLQQLFNQSVVADEVQTCREEGVELPEIEFEIDSGVVRLLEAKSPQPGLLLMLDEEIKVVGGSDDGWMRKIIKLHGDSDLLSDRPPKSTKKQKKGGKRGSSFPAPKRCFWISHYAGIVEYHVDGFLEKNKDTVPDSLSEVVQSSTSSFISELFPKKVTEEKSSGRSSGSGGSGRSGRSGRGGRSNATKKKSLVKNFRLSLSSLIATLEKSIPHYIRCIKPNSLNQPKLIHPGMVSRQLSCSGLHDVVRLRKEGYSYRILHTDFVKRFFPLLRWQMRKQQKEAKQNGGKSGLTKVASMRSMNQTQTASEQALQIINTLTIIYPGLDKECCVGHTKVLIREMPYQWLERYLDVIRDRASRLVQRTARGRRDRNKTNAIKSAKNMLRAAIEQGDLQRAQDLLQVARKRISNNLEMGQLLTNEINQIENMVLQSRSQRKLGELIKNPITELWSQRQLLQALVAEVQTGQLEASEEELVKAKSILNSCIEMEDSVTNLDTAISAFCTSGMDSEKNLHNAVNWVSHCALKYGDYCSSTLNSAKSMLKKGSGGGGGGSGSSSHALLGRNAPVEDAAAKREKKRRIEKERNSIQEEIRKRENELKVNALREIELLKMKIINGDVEEKLIEHLSDVVTSVEEYANSRGSKQRVIVREL